MMLGYEKALEAELLGLAYIVDETFVELLLSRNIDEASGGAAENTELQINLPMRANV